MIQEDPGPRDMFLKQVDLYEIASLKGVREGLKLEPLIRKGREDMPDMQLTIDVGLRPDQAGEIGLKIPLWSKVEFRTSSTQLVIDIPDSDEEDLCRRNENNPTRLVLCSLNPKYLEKTAPFVDGIVSTDGKSLDVRAIYNKNALPSNCGPEIEMMGLGNWDIIKEDPELNVNEFESSTNYCVQIQKFEQDNDDEQPKEKVLLQKESLEDRIALEPLEVPNMDLAFNFGNDLEPDSRWNFSAKCQRRGVQSAVSQSTYIHPPGSPTIVEAQPFKPSRPQPKPLPTWHGSEEATESQTSPPTFTPPQKTGNVETILLNLQEYSKVEIPREKITQDKKEISQSSQMELSNTTSNDYEAMDIDIVEINRSFQNINKKNTNEITMKDDLLVQDTKRSTSNKYISKVRSENIHDITMNEEVSDNMKNDLTQIEVNKIELKDNVDLLCNMISIVSTNEMVLKNLSADGRKILELLDENHINRNSFLKISYTSVQHILEIVAKIQHVFIYLLFKEADKSMVHLPTQEESEIDLLGKYYQVLDNILKIVGYIQALIWSFSRERLETHDLRELNKQKILYCYHIFENIVEIVSGMMKASGIEISPNASIITKDVAQSTLNVWDCINGNICRINNLKEIYERKSIDKAKSENFIAMNAIQRRFIPETISAPTLIPKRRSFMEARYQNYKCLIQNILDIMSIVQAMLQDILLSGLMATSSTESQMRLPEKQQIQKCQSMINDVHNVLFHAHSIFESLYIGRQDSGISVKSQNYNFKSIENDFQNTSKLIREVSSNVTNEEIKLKEFFSKFSLENNFNWQKSFTNGRTEKLRYDEATVLIQNIIDVISKVQFLSEQAYRTHSVPHHEFTNHAKPQHLLDLTDTRSIAEFDTKVCQVLENALKEQNLIEKLSQVNLNQSSNEEKLKKINENLNLEQSINSTMLNLTFKVQEMIKEASSNLILLSPIPSPPATPSSELRTEQEKKEEYSSSNDNVAPYVQVPTPQETSNLTKSKEPIDVEMKDLDDKEGTPAKPQSNPFQQNQRRLNILYNFLSIPQMKTFSSENPSQICKTTSPSPTNVASTNTPNTKKLNNEKLASALAQVAQKRMQNRPFF